MKALKKISGLCLFWALLLVSTGNNAEAASSWEIIYQKPAVNLLDLSIPNMGQTAYAVGTIGKFGGQRISSVLKSSDGGASWEYLDFPLSSQVAVNCVHFISDQKGWIGGSNGYIAKTTDAGQSWQVFNLGSTTSVDKLFFLDEQTGWAVGSGNGFILFKTTDGGQTWTDLGHDEQTYYLKDIVFLDENNGWASGAIIDATGFFPVIIRTHDGGLSWQHQSLPHLQVAQYVEIASLSFVSENTGWASLSSIWSPDKGVVLKTTNGGQTWEVALNTGLPYIYTIAARDEQTVALVASDFLFSTTNRLYLSTDNGNSWQHHDIPTQGIMYSLAWSEDRLITCTRHSTILSNTISGDQWKVRHQSMFASDITWASLEKGIVTTGTSKGDNYVMTTDNGGSVWEHNPSLPGGSFVSFVDEQRGWFFRTGEPASVIRTLNGGESWEEFPVANASGVQRMTVVSPESIWAYGAQGSLYKSQDQGETWTQMPSGTTMFIQSMHFINDTTGWIAGGFGLNNGFVRKTTDGGETWSAQSIPVNSHIRSVFFADAVNGFMISVEGNFFKTLDGGSTWHFISNFPGKDLYTIYMLTDDYGFMAAYNEMQNGDGTGFIFHTQDGGNTWVQAFASDKPSSSILRFMPRGSGELWASGMHNQIMRFTIPLRTLSLQTDPPGHGQLQGEGQYHIGQQVWVDLSISDEYSFIGWADPEGNIISTEPGFLFTMPSANITLTALLDLNSSVSENQPVILDVYPNPARSHFVVKTDTPFTKLSLHDLNGRTLRTYDQSGHSLHIDTHGLDAGTYLIKVFFDHYTETKRLVIH